MEVRTALRQGPVPLAVRMRPTSLDDVAGQAHLLRPGSPLRMLTGDREPVLEFNWPPLDGLNPLQLVTAIVAADSTQKMPPLTTVRLLLSALGVPNVDEVLAEVTDEEGNFLDPTVSAGDVAVNAFNRGEDPASAVR